jgi:hypothetical protein
MVVFLSRRRRIYTFVDRTSAPSNSLYRKPAAAARSEGR